MKNTLFLFLFLCSSTVLFSQTKEWEKVVSLLQKEATYFEGKKGFFRLNTSSFNEFEITSFKIYNDWAQSEMIVSDRFSDIQAHHQEFLDFENEPEIESVNIMYGYNGFFEEYPKYVFLKIVFTQKWYIHLTTTLFVNPETGVYEERKHEIAADALLVPIRSKNRNKIFKALNRFMETNFKKELEIDILERSY